MRAQDDSRHACSRWIFAREKKIRDAFQNGTRRFPHFSHGRYAREMGVPEVEVLLEGLDGGCFVVLYIEYGVELRDLQ